jgi:hypothetical protein
VRTERLQAWIAALGRGLEVCRRLARYAKGRTWRQAMAGKKSDQTRARLANLRLSNASDPGPFKLVILEPSRKEEYEELRRRLGRGGAPRKRDRDRRWAEVFLMRRKAAKGKISDTALMKKIGKEKSLSPSAAIEAITKGCKEIVRVHGTPEIKRAVEQNQMSIVKAAAASLQRKNPSGK